MARFVLLFLFFPTLLFTIKQQDDKVKIYYENNGTSITVYADYKGSIPRSVKLNLKQKGFKIKGKEKDFYPIPPKANRVILMELERSGKGKATFSFSFTIFQGFIDANHNDSFIYTLPFKSDVPFLLSQGYNGDFSHKQKNALDFTMPEGTEIVAARGGRIIDLKSNSNKGCNKPKCIESANFVTILHDDGSFAQYFHLKHNGVSVALDQDVSQGETIGYSGNTGYTSGPHLHFEINVASTKELKTVATQFDIGGKKKRLKVGEKYSSNHQ